MRPGTAWPRSIGLGFPLVMSVGNLPREIDGTFDAGGSAAAEGKGGEGGPCVCEDG